MTEKHQPQEPLPSSEIFSTGKEMVGLHTRMALAGEALDPEKKDLPKITEEQLTLENLAKTTEIAAKGSVVDRINWWEKRWQEEVTKDSSLLNITEEEKQRKQYEMWVSQMVEGFSNPNNQQIINRLKPRKIGGIDLSNFTEQTAAQIYQRYFADQEQKETVAVVVLKENGQEKLYLPSNLNQFIDDVIQAYEGNYQEIVNNLDALTWYAGIFGSTTKEVLREIIHTRIKLENEEKKQELITQANETREINGQQTLRCNWLNEKERTLLAWLKEAEKAQTKTITTLPTPYSNHHRPLASSEIDNRTFEYQLNQSKSPWDKVPRPAQPTKIKEANVTQSTDPRTGREIIRRIPETYLIWGTREHPLVVEILNDGRRERVRIVDEERPYHIPAIIYFDDDLTLEQKQVVRETVQQIAAEVGLPDDFIIESSRSAAEFFSKTSPPKERPSQYLGSLFLWVAENDPSHIETPHHVFAFTNRDITDYTDGGFFNFLVGEARSDLGTIISLKRIWQGINDPKLRRETIRTEIAHEIGHVYNLPSTRRGEKNLDYETVRGGGGHCKSPGCSMKQGNAVPADFIRITEERLKILGKDRFYCDECHRDIKEKFRN